jgi:hypothetical protein
MFGPFVLIKFSLFERFGGIILQVRPNAVYIIFQLPNEGRIHFFFGTELRPCAIFELLKLRYEIQKEGAANASELEKSNKNLAAKAL